MTTALRYNKNDVRRILCVLAVIGAKADGARMIEIVDATGLDKRTAADMIQKAEQQLGVVFSERATRLSAWRIVDWGPLVNQDGVRLAAKGKLGC